MFRNYIKIAWRNLVRNKSYSLINTIGLSVGVASCLLIFLFIQDELSYDRYHEKSDRIYRVFKEFEVDGTKRKTLSTSYLLAPALKEEILGVENGVRISKRWSEVLVERGSTKFSEDKFFFTDPTFFEIFTHPFIKGNPQTALSRPFTVVITEEVAEKYYGDENPIGKTLSIEGLWGSDDYEVTGIVKNVPQNSHFSFDFLTSMETLRSKEPNPKDKFENWYFNGSYTYILLNKGVGPASLRKNLDDFYKKHHPEEQAPDQEYHLQSLTDIHLHSDFERELEANSDIRYIYIFGSVAFLILFIAGMNYTNLATARSMERAIEVGIRKTLGVDRKRLVLQFLSETFVYCFISLLLGLLIAETTLPYFNEITGKSIEMSLLSFPLIISCLVTLFLLVLLAGSYPSLVLSRFTPIQSLRGASLGNRKSALRNSLVVFQFVISIILIVGTLVINEQLNFLQNKRLGLNKSHIVSFSTDKGFRKTYSSFKDRLKSYEAVKEVTHMSPMLPSSIRGFYLKPEGLEPRGVDFIQIGDDFVETLEMRVSQGQDLTGLSRDSLGGYIPALINEAAVKDWGWENPLGKTFDGYNATVVGVVENFHFRSLKEQIAPLLITSTSYVNNVLVKIDSKNTRRAISFIEDTWQEMGPGTPLEYTFLDDRYDSLYKAEDRLATVFSNFSILAIIIACLGLLGLAAYTAESRTKEIGIRKVLGATISNIVTLLSKDFLKLVLLGFVIAVPIAWYAMSLWLADFAYRIEMGVGIFLMAGGVALVIALATVSWQSFRAALANPVDSLRSE